MKNQLKGTLGLSLIVAMMTGTLITLFLSGKIIEIPHGTREGGIISATGVAVIIISMGIIGILIKKLIKVQNNKFDL